MAKIIIVHGWDGSPKHGWFPWLKNELEKKWSHCYYSPITKT